MNPLIFAPAMREISGFVFDLVAQLVEHLPFKERVPGSSPGQVTKASNQIKWFGGFFMDSSEFKN
jgi:hypothetical protein